MPLQKYELAENWYNARLQQNNGDKHQTLIDLINYGLYEREINGFDTPRDYRLEDVDSKNITFIYKILHEIIREGEDPLNETTALVTSNKNKIDQLTQLITDKVSVTNTQLGQKLPKDGSKALTGDLNMGNRQIGELGDPTANTDLVNKQTVNQTINTEIVPTHANTSSYIKADGSSSITGDLNIGNKRIVDLANPSSDKDAVNKQWLSAYSNQKLGEKELDSFVPLSGGEAHKMTGDLDMNNYKIINVPMPNNDDNLVPRDYAIDHPTGLVKLPVSNISELLSIVDPRTNEVRYVRDQQALYYHNPMISGGLISTTGGRWNKIDNWYHGDYAYNSITYGAGHFNLDFSSAKWLGDDPHNGITQYDDMTFYGIYNRGIVTISARIGLSFSNGANASRSGFSYIPLRFPWDIIIRDLFPKFDIHFPTMLEQVTWLKWKDTNDKPFTPIRSVDTQPVGEDTEVVFVSYPHTFSRTRSGTYPDEATGDVSNKWMHILVTFQVHNQ